MGFPLAIGGARLVERRPWLERALTVTSVPVAVALLSRFVTGQWAG